MLRLVAKHGGVLAHKGEDQLGVKIIWREWQYVIHFAIDISRLEYSMRRRHAPAGAPKNARLHPFEHMLIARRFCFYRRYHCQP